MKKLATLLALAALLFVGCSEEPIVASGNKNSTTLSSSSLVGTWKNATTSYTFTSAGKLTVTSSGNALPAVNWTLKGDTLFLEGTPSYTLKLSGSTLSFYSSGQKLMDLVKEGSTSTGTTTGTIKSTDLVGTWKNSSTSYTFTSAGKLTISSYGSSAQPVNWSLKGDTLLMAGTPTYTLKLSGSTLSFYANGQKLMDLVKDGSSGTGTTTGTIKSTDLVGTWTNAQTSYTFTSGGKLTITSGGTSIPAVTWSLKGDTLFIEGTPSYTLKLSGSTLTFYSSGQKLMDLTKSTSIQDTLKVDLSKQIIGTWEESYMTLKFNSDKTGRMAFTDTYPNTAFEFMWSMKNDTLFLDDMASEVKLSSTTLEFLSGDFKGNTYTRVE